MLITGNSKEVSRQVDFIKSSGKTVGFVPTMGALHRGHISLVEQCNKECDYTVVSVFVNPTQFNDKEDYKRYPRVPEEDSKMLKEAGCDLVFMPTEQEIYPEPDTSIFDFTPLDKVMEGAFRPGHFNGVAQIVSRLFDIVKPDKAFFGLKDFQQLAIIRRLVQQVNRPVTIVDCNIIREADGLAMSSRNMLLNADQREAAPTIYRVLMQAKELVTELNPDQLKAYVTDQINVNSELKIEYAEVVDAGNLQPIKAWNDAQSVQLCVAVQVGKIRLIDNINLI
ncbi:MAG: pantoate--beta-alanine ligase [Prevotellaceae bacterium]|jgi:pantoate--beta-alanine ligase|nr:pantoate--beta-alanine ligase [Prevotellaceae bacterium]